MTKLLQRLSAVAISLLLTGLSHLTLAQAPAPIKQWDKTFGGNDEDELIDVQRTSDGGYVLGGYSRSGVSGDKTQANQGSYDYWVLKLDATGTKQWDKTFGGSQEDKLFSLQQTSDGGYILGGWSDSPSSGDKTQASQGSYDYWVLKLDANGTKQWDKTFGGSSLDILFSIQQTSDGGYALGGYSRSGLSGDKTQASQGGPHDYWLVKLDAAGTKQWDKTFGGSQDDILGRMQQTSDGGYILGGWSNSPSSGDKTQASRGGYDYWVLKLDASGTKQWDRTFGGSAYEESYALQQTSDGGYLLGGSSTSGISGDKTQASQGMEDYWLVKLDANGTKQWDRTLGGNYTDMPSTVQQTSDGGYMVGGLSRSDLSGDKTQANQGGQGFRDYWVVKLDASGTKLWDLTFGGNDNEYLNSVQQTSEGGYLLGGYSYSGLSGDKTQASQGGYDYWLVKLSAMPLATTSATTRPTLSAYPNPLRTQLTLCGPPNTTYQLLTQLGQVVRSGQVAAQPLDVQALPAGLYLLRDQTTGYTTKLVKE
jgi:hypothetical protein